MVATDLGLPANQNLSPRDQQMRGSQSSRPSARFAGWINDKVNQAVTRPKQQGEQEIAPQKFKEVTGILLNGEQPRKQYLAGLDFVIQTVEDIDIEVKDNPKYLDILKFLVNDPRRDAVLGLLNTKLKAMVQTNSQDIELAESVYQIFALTEPLFAKNLARVLSGRFNGFSFSDEDNNVPDIAKGEVGVKRHLMTLGPNGQDVLEYFTTDDVPPEEVKKFLTIFKTVWDAIRSSPDKKRCTIIFINSVNKPKVHPFSFMETPASICVELKWHDLEGMAVHETVHACMGAESGGAYSIDFMEGCATRIGDAFIPDRYSNLPDQRIVEVLKQASQAGILPRSSTTVLTEAEARGIHVDRFTWNYAQYTYGYFLIDSLLQSPKYRAMYQEATARGERPFYVLNMINSKFNDIGRQYAPQRNATMIRRGLLDAGFSNQDINDILAMTDQAIKNFQPSVPAVN